MRPKITLHIGIGKTGTSAIQAALARNHDALKAHGALYPEHDSFDLARSGQVTSGNLVPDGKGWFEDQLMTTVRKNPGYSTYIFSSEYLWWQMDSFVRTSALYRDDYDFDIVLFVRDPFEFLNSSYQQKVKTGGFFLGLREYSPLLVSFGGVKAVLEALEKRGIGYTMFNYSVMRREVVKRFFKHLGLWDVVSSDPANIGTINRSLTAAELNFIRYVNQIFGASYGTRIANALVSQLPAITADIVPINEETRREVCEKNESYIHYLNERLAPSEQLTLIPPQPSSALGDDYVLSREQIEVIKNAFLQALLEQRGVTEVGERTHALSRAASERCAD